MEAIEQGHGGPEVLFAKRKHAQNGGCPRGDRSVEPAFCATRHERIGADRARVAALVWRHSVRVFGAQMSSAGRQFWRAQARPVLRQGTLVRPVWGALRRARLM